jgi:PKD repeat protein
MKKTYSVIILTASLLLLLSGSNIKAQTYATLPFVEHFDSTWINDTTIRDIPSKYWINTPETGDNSWRRDDDGASAGWEYPSDGGYSPSGANGTAHSARFHSYEAGDYSGKLDLYVNFSTASGNTGLSFWFINPWGNEGLQVYLSTDGGSSFGITSLGTLYKALDWTKVTVNLGNVTSSTGVIRFKAIGTTKYTSDIGIDEVEVGEVTAGFTANVTSGIAPLTVKFTDQSLGLPTSWKWDFNNDGVVDSTTQNPSYTYTKGGIYSVKLVASNPGSTDSIVKTNYIKVNAYASLPYYENFDSTWINNEGTRDVPSQYWTNTPATGDNSWRRDDDGASAAWDYPSNGIYSPSGANGTAHSARFHSSYNTVSGTLDVNINFLTRPVKDTVSFYYINTGGSDSLEVFLSLNGDSSFTKIGSQTTQANWDKIAIGLGNISSPIGVIRFKATGDFGNSDIGIDEVNITGISNHDDITAFSLPGQTGNAIIDTSAHTIGITVPYGTDVSSLAATFTLSPSASAKVGTTTQVSDTTTNDFTSSVTYVVTAQDGVTTQNWTVKVTIAPNTQADITVFSLPGQIGSAVINSGTHNINVTMIKGTSVSSLAASFTLSFGATAKVGTTPQVSDTTTNDFTSSVTYVVTAQDGFTVQDWTVTIVPASNQTAITAFSLPGQTGNANIDTTTHTIDITMPYRTNISFLVATFTLSPSASAKVGTTAQVSGTTINDFTSPVTYVVTAQDGITTQNWTVSVTIALNNQADITAFSLPGQTGNATINSGTNTVNINMSNRTNVSSLAATFTLSAGATAKVGTIKQVSGVTPNNFSSPVIYVVIAQDGVTTQNWTVSVAFLDGLVNVASDEEVVVNPNPSNGLFQLKMTALGRLQIEVYNLLGNRIMNQTVNVNGESIIPVNLSGNPAGMYLLRVVSGGKATLVKLVLQ